jgi:hypothetical protein
MLDVPFLTQIDPHARIKGSRDPLGLQPIWSRLGRCVVHNLTTVTTSLRAFTTLLLGLYVAECVAEEVPDDEGRLLATFLKFEQLAAYSRVVVSQRINGANVTFTDDDENAIRGIRRVARNLNEKKERVPISAKTENQILSNQKVYGVWGIYSVAARNSGWLDSGGPRLTLSARDFIEQNYRAHLESVDHNADVFRLLRSDFTFEPTGRHARLAQNLAQLLGTHVTSAEQTFYYKHLITAAASHSDDIQERLWKQIQKAAMPGSFGYAELLYLIDQCRAEGDAMLAERLDHIRVMEAVIAPAGRLFAFALEQDGRTLEAVEQDVRSAWGEELHYIEPELLISALGVLGDDINADMRDRLRHLAEAMCRGRYAEAIEHLLEQNRAVMQERGGDAWIKRKKGRLDVRLRAEMSDLPPAQDVPALWINNYFLNSLKQIGFGIGQGA